MGPGKWKSPKDLANEARPGDIIQVAPVTRFNSKWYLYKGDGHVFEAAKLSDYDEALVRSQSLTVVMGDSNNATGRINNKESEARTRGLTARSGTEAVKAASEFLGQTIFYSIEGIDTEYWATKWKYGQGWSFRLREREIIRSIHKL